MAPEAGSPASSMRNVRAALLWQAGAGAAGMLAAALRFDGWVAFGVGFGVLIVMLSSLLLGRRIDAAAAAGPERGSRMLYAGAVMRFMLVLLALLAAWLIGLHLLAVAAGMLLAQAAVFACAVAGLKRQMGNGTV